jgi:hypothetical protein
VFKSTGLVLLLVLTVFVAASCGGRSDPWLGTYSNSNGSITLDVKGGGKASFTALGQTLECTYTTREQTMSLNCPEPAGNFTFGRQSDGSIVAQDNPIIGRLTKSQR